MDSEGDDETTVLLRSNSRSTLELQDEYKSRQRSIRVLYFTNFLGAVGFSVVMPSVWPYLQVIYPEAKTSFLGLVIASYSLGQFVMSPVLGWLSNYLKRSDIPLILGLSCQLVGNLLWAYLQDIPVMNGYSMVLARTFIGVGAANMAVIRSYVSKATTLQERTGVNAIISACQALGFCLGPGLQAALVPLGHPGPVELPGFHLNTYTGAGWVCVLLTVTNIIAIITIFRDHEVPDELESGLINAETSSNSVSTSDSTHAVMKPDYLVVSLLLISFFVILFLFVMFETMSTPLSMYEYGWSKPKAIFYNGIIWTCTGVISIVVVLLMRGPLKKVSERFMLIIGYVLLIIGMVVYLPYGGSKPTIKWVNSTTANSTAGGCPSNLDWCFYVPQVHLAQLLGATFFLSLGYPAVNLLIYTLYSKVLGPIPQGLWMGLFTAAGSLARMLGPIYVGAILQAYGPLVTLASVGGMLTVSWVIILLIYRRLVPYAARISDNHDMPSG